MSKVGNRIAAIVAIVSIGLIGVRAQRPTGQAALGLQKDVIERFYALANSADVNRLKPLVSEDYIEHSDIPDGREGLLQSIASNATTPIGAVFAEERRRIRGDIVRIIAEGDQVWTYVQVKGARSRVARVDMFRVVRGLVAEHWAVVEDVNEKRNNSNDNFAMGRGPQDVVKQSRRVQAAVQGDILEANKNVVRTFYQNRESGGVDVLKRIMRDDYIQHNASGADGAAPLQRPRRGSAGPQNGTYNPNEIVRLVAEGDFVWAFIRGQAGRRLQLNQYRVEDGRLAEQWGVYQTVNDDKANTNNWFGFGRGPVADFSR